MSDQVFQGDNSPLYTVGGFTAVSLVGSDWRCQFVVASADLATTYVSRSVTDLSDDFLNFQAHITAAESKTLPPGEYVAVFEITNISDAEYTREAHNDVEILAQAVHPTTSTDLTNPIPGGNIVVVEAPYVDFAGAPVTPVSASYVVTDQDGNEVIASTPITIGGLSAFITIPGASNAVTAGVAREGRVLTMTVVTASTTHVSEIIYVLNAAQQLILLTNSFQTFPQSIVNGMDIGEIDTFKAATPREQITAMIEAFHQIVKLRFQVAGTVYSLMALSTTEFEELPADFKRALREAQILQSDFNLGGQELEKRIQEGVMAETIGESSMFLRPRPPLRLGISRKTLKALNRYMDWSLAAGRG